MRPARWMEHPRLLHYFDLSDMLLCYPLLLLLLADGHLSEAEVRGDKERHEGGDEAEQRRTEQDQVLNDHRAVDLHGKARLKWAETEWENAKNGY